MAYELTRKGEDFLMSYWGNESPFTSTFVDPGPYYPEEVEMVSLLNTVMQSGNLPSKGVVSTEVRRLAKERGLVRPIGQASKRRRRFYSKSKVGAESGLFQWGRGQQFDRRHALRTRRRLDKGDVPNWLEDLEKKGMQYKESM